VSKFLTDSSAIKIIQELGLKHIHSHFPGIYYYGVTDSLTTFLIIVFIQFSIQSAFIADFMSNSFTNIFLCKFLKTCHAELN
jgi:uncharacterized membrane protein YagU involved in acid resistance